MFSENEYHGHTIIGVTDETLLVGIKLAEKSMRETIPEEYRDGGHIWLLRNITGKPEKLKYDKNFNCVTWLYVPTNKIDGSHIFKFVEQKIEHKNAVIYELW